MGFLKFYFQAKKNIETRTIIKSGQEKTYYICNYGIPDSYVYYRSKNVLFESRADAIYHAYTIYKSAKI